MVQASKPENTKIRIFITIVIGCAAVFLFYFLLEKIQNASEIRQVQREMEENILELKERYPDARFSFEIIDEAIDELYEEDLYQLSCFSKMDPEFRISDEYLDHVDPAGLFYDIRILDWKGNVLASLLGEPMEMTSGMKDALDQAFEIGEIVIFPHRETLASSSSGEESKETENNEDPMLEEQYGRWYMIPFDDEHAFAVRVDEIFTQSTLIYTNPWKILMENNTIGDSGFTFAWDDQSGKILYYPGEEAEVRNGKIQQTGLNPDEIEDSVFSWKELEGQRMYVYAEHFPEERAWVACAVSEKELEGASRFNRAVLCILFAMLDGILVYYAILLLKQKKVRVLTDFTHSGAVAAHKSRKQKLLILTCAIAVILFLFHVYLQTLYLMSRWAASASAQTMKIEDTISEQEILAKAFASFYDEHKQRQLTTMGGLLSRMPGSTVDPSVLDDLSYAVHAHKIQILDSEGGVLSETSSMSYPDLLEMEVLDDAASTADAVALQDKGKKAEEWMSEGRKVLMPIQEDAAAIKRYLYVQYYSLMADLALRQLSMEQKMSMIRPGKGGFVFSLDTETNKFESFPDENLNGRDALEYGLKKNQIKDNYCDYIQINGTSYYAVSDMIGTQLIYYAIAKDDLLSRRFPIAIATVLGAVILLLLTGMGLYTSREQIEMVQPDEGRHMLEDEKNSPEYKVLRVFIYYMIIGAILFTGYSNFLARQNGDGILGSVLGGRWEPGFNVFALTSSVIILCRGGLILFFGSKLIHILGDILPVHAGTILKMIGSLVIYVAVGVLLYQCAICFGMNPTALMASAGIVSVVLGIGANSLVGDILAGIFLLMEGNVQVGDVVQVGDFRGYVMDLGIRMTKLFDMDSDDVKIIPNNELRNVVHMTMRASIVYSEFQIRYEEHLELVEQILRDELRKVPHKSSLILSGPVYIGVERLDDNGVVLKTATRCHESSRRKVEREVNHIVYSIFQKHQISVPYPQVTMHMGEDEMVERDVTSTAPEDKK